MVKRLLEDAEIPLPEAERERLSALFNKLDVNKDGKIDITDLSKAWSKLNVPHQPGRAEVNICFYYFQIRY